MCFYSQVCQLFEEHLLYLGRVSTPGTGLSTGTVSPRGAPPTITVLTLQARELG